MDTINLSVFATEQGREEFQTLIEPLVQRTYGDPVFKEEFITHPKEVIRRETGLEVDLPDNWRFVVNDQSNPFSLYIHLHVREDDIELTDDELEVVAGGGGEPNVNCKGGNCKAGCGASS